MIWSTYQILQRGSCTWNVFFPVSFSFSNHLKGYSSSATKWTRWWDNCLHANDNNDPWKSVHMCILKTKQWKWWLYCILVYECCKKETRTSYDTIQSRHKADVLSFCITLVLLCYIHRKQNSIFHFFYIQVFHHVASPFYKTHLVNAMIACSSSVARETAVMINDNYNHSLNYPLLFFFFCFFTSCSLRLCIYSGIVGSFQKAWAELPGQAAEEAVQLTFNG